MNPFTKTALLLLALVVDIAYPGNHCLLGALFGLGIVHVTNAAFPRPEPTEK